MQAYSYFLADHLGNNRVLFSDTNNDGVAELIQNQDFYPFGMAFNGDFISNSSTKLLYNFKEQVNDFGLGWMDFGERYYLGGGIPRFLNVKYL